MLLAPGTRLSTFEVIGPIGTGGMGDVYRARDLKLGRDVALKVLRERFTDDDARIDRFRREAQLLASLNHTNIGAIYGLEEVGPVRALVLELVDGPTLRDRIRQGPLPLAETVDIARQIADALNAAHDRGIIHRDLKPGNIKLTPEGRVKVLDFGIAKVLDDDTADRSGEMPTMTSGETRAGVSLGTPAYMSPEQSRGVRVDRRTDIWAFGCVLFEMLTGRPAFDGNTATDITAATLRDEPSWNDLPPEIPAGARRVLQRCLQKDSRRRFRDIADVQIELEESLTRPDTQERRAESRRLPSRVWPWVTAVLAAVAIALAWLLSQARGTAVDGSPPTRFALDFATIAIRSTAAGPYLTVSADGRRVVFAGSAPGPGQLYLRALDSLTPVPIAGTEGGVRPFFSPDGQWIGFFADGKLKKVSLGGGEAVTLTEASPQVARGGTWHEDGSILLGMTGGKFLRVRADSGATEEIAGDPADSDAAYRWAEWVPGSDVVLFTVVRTNQFDIAAMSMSSRQRKVLIKGGTQPKFVRANGATAGHIVFAQQVSNDPSYLFSGALFAVAFEPATLAVGGDARPVQDGVHVRGGAGAASFGISTTGTLVYLPGDPHERRQIMWVDRTGQSKPIGGPPRVFRYPRLAPDRERLAVYVADPNPGLWLFDIGRDSWTRLPIEPNAGRTPIWSADGRRLAFTAEDQQRAWVAPVDNPKMSQPLKTPPARQELSGWSPDGRLIALEAFDDKTGLDIWIVPADGSAPAAPWLQTPAGESRPSFSPDGKWIVYQSNESGRPEVYVSPFPGPGNPIAISRTGGSQPQWTREGREITYRQNMTVMAVDFTAGTASTPKLLFRGRYGIDFDAAHDGSAFVLTGQVDEQVVENQLVVVLNWFPEFRRRLQTRN